MDWKREKLALLEELLVFMERFEWTGTNWSDDYEDSYVVGCLSCETKEEFRYLTPEICRQCGEFHMNGKHDIIGGHICLPDKAKRGTFGKWGHVGEHTPDCRDTVRRKEFEMQIAELKSLLT